MSGIECDARRLRANRDRLGEGADSMATMQRRQRIDAANVNDDESDGGGAGATAARNRADERAREGI